MFESDVLTRKLAERLGIELPGTRRLLQLIPTLTSVTQHFPSSPFFSSCCCELNEVFGVAVLLEKVSDKLEIGYLEHTNNTSVNQERIRIRIGSGYGYEIRIRIQEGKITHKITKS